MNTIAKLSALMVTSVALAVTTGCATKRNNTSEVVVAPMGVPGNAVYGTGVGLVNNSVGVVAAAENVQGVVYFAFDSSAIDAQAASVLDQQASFLASNPNAAVLVAGHTDERGSREYNHALGERRAQAVKSYLAAKGVNGARVETISYGEEQPAVQGSTEAAYAQNRRATLSY